MNNFNCIIFDLDGTLIDSSISVLNSFRYVLSSNSIIENVPLNSSVIGPPLKNAFIMLLGNSYSNTLIETLISDFKKIYDEKEFKNTIPYYDIEYLLKQLKNARIKLFIATNKRLIPTKKIIDYFYENTHVCIQVFCPPTASPPPSQFVIKRF